MFCLRRSVCQPSCFVKRLSPLFANTYGAFENDDLCRLFSTTLKMSTDKKLFTPGPLGTSPTVKAEMLRDLGSRDIEFLNLIKYIRSKLIEIAGVSSTEWTAVPMQGSGTFAIESFFQTAIPRSGAKTYLWVKKLQGVPKGVLWPAILVIVQSDGAVVYIKSDNAELFVRQSNMQPFCQIESFKAKSVDFDEAFPPDKPETVTLHSGKKTTAGQRVRWTDAETIELNPFPNKTWFNF